MSALTIRPEPGTSWVYVEAGERTLGVVGPETIIGHRTGQWEWRTVSGAGGVEPTQGAAVRTLCRLRAEADAFWDRFTSAVKPDVARAVAAREEAEP